MSVTIEVIKIKISDKNDKIERRNILTGHWKTAEKKQVPVSANAEVGLALLKADALFTVKEE